VLARAQLEIKLLGGLDKASEFCWRGLRQWG